MSDCAMCTNEAQRKLTDGTLICNDIDCWMQYFAAITVEEYDKGCAACGYIEGSEDGESWAEHQNHIALEEDDERRGFK